MSTPSSAYDKGNISRGSRIPRTPIPQQQPPPAPRTVDVRKSASRRKRSIDEITEELRDKSDNLGETFSISSSRPRSFARRKSSALPATSFFDKDLDKMTDSEIENAYKRNDLVPSQIRRLRSSVGVGSARSSISSASDDSFKPSDSQINEAMRKNKVLVPPPPKSTDNTEIGSRGGTFTIDGTPLSDSAFENAFKANVNIIVPNYNFNSKSNDETDFSKNDNDSFNPSESKIIDAMRKNGPYIPPIKKSTRRSSIQSDTTDHLSDSAYERLFRKNTNLIAPGLKKSIPNTTPESEDREIIEEQANSIPNTASNDNDLETENITYEVEKDKDTFTKEPEPINVEKENDNLQEDESDDETSTFIETFEKDIVKRLQRTTRKSLWIESIEDSNAPESTNMTRSLIVSANNEEASNNDNFSEKQMEKESLIVKAQTPQREQQVPPKAPPIRKKAEKQVEKEDLVVKAPISEQKEVSPRPRGRSTRRNKEINLEERQVEKDVFKAPSPEPQKEVPPRPRGRSTRRNKEINLEEKQVEKDVFKAPSPEPQKEVPPRTRGRATRKNNDINLAEKDLTTKTSTSKPQQEQLPLKGRPTGKNKDVSINSNITGGRKINHSTPLKTAGKKKLNQINISAISSQETFKDYNSLMSVKRPRLEKKQQLPQRGGKVASNIPILKYDDVINEDEDSVDELTLKNNKKDEKATESDSETSFEQEPEHLPSSCSINNDYDSEVSFEDNDDNQNIIEKENLVKTPVKLIEKEKSSAAKEPAPKPQQEQIPVSPKPKARAASRKNKEINSAEQQLEKEDIIAEDPAPALKSQTKKPTLKVNKVKKSKIILPKKAEVNKAANKLRKRSLGSNEGELDQENVDSVKYPQDSAPSPLKKRLRQSLRLDSNKTDKNVDKSTGSLRLPLSPVLQRSAKKNLKMDDKIKKTKANQKGKTNVEKTQEILPQSPPIIQKSKDVNDLRKLCKPLIISLPKLRPNEIKTITNQEPEVVDDIPIPTPMVSLEKSPEPRKITKKSIEKSSASKASLKVSRNYKKKYQQKSRPLSEPRKLPKVVSKKKKEEPDEKVGPGKVEYIKLFQVQNRLWGKMNGSDIKLLHQVINSYINLFLNQIQSNCKDIYGKYSYLELERALAAEGLIPKKKGYLLSYMASIFNTEQMKLVLKNGLFPLQERNVAGNFPE